MPKPWISSQGREPEDGRFVAAVFLLFGLIFGTLLGAAVPPFGGSDEFYHWYRVQQIARGELLARHRGGNDWGGPVDAAAVEFSLALFQRMVQEKAPLSAEETRRLADDLARRPPATLDWSFPSTGGFPPLAYLPASLGVAVARMAGGDPLDQVLAARFANLLVWLAAMGLVIRLLPVGRMAVATLALSPVALHQAASISADPLNLALPLLLAALVWRVRRETGPIPRGVLAGIAGLCLSLAALKPLYAVFALVLFLVPDERLGGVRPAAIRRWGLLAATVGLSLAWQAAYPFRPGLYWGSSADPPGAVLAALLADPAGMLATAWNSLRYLAGPLLTDGYLRIGGHAAPYIFPLELTSVLAIMPGDGEAFVNGVRTVPPALSAAALAAWTGMALLALADGPKEPDSDRARVGAVFAGTAIGFTVLLVAAFRVAYSPIETALVLGLQGRYFLLPAALALLALAGFGSRRPAVRTALFGALLMANGTVIILALRHYGSLWDLLPV